MNAATTPQGHARRKVLSSEEPFSLECGRSLGGLEIAYETWGEPDAEGGNAILVVHALTGDAHASSHGCGEGAAPGWWEGLIGPGKTLDPARHFLVCANLLGSCYGTTGPAETDPDTGRPYGSLFPPVTPRDMARAQKRLLDHLGVRSLALALGGSLGAMVAWELAAEYGGFVRRLAAIAGTPTATPWAIALNHVARGAILSDPSWCGGDYRDGGPRGGLALARALGMISYRTGELFSERFGTERRDPSPEGAFDPENLFQVESYLVHQGRKLVDRFDARSYVALTRAMDMHDLGRGRGGPEEALASVQAEVLCVGIDTDLLFFPREMRGAAAALGRAGVRARYAEIASRFGHDAFLVEFGQLGGILGDFLAGRTP